MGSWLERRHGISTIKRGNVVPWDTYRLGSRSILSVVAMIPIPLLLDGYNNQYFMVEKIGLDVIEADVLEDDE